MKLFKGAGMIFKIVYNILFRSNRFYCQLSAGHKFDFRIWEMPGRWCSDDELNTLVQDMRIIACEDGESTVPAYGALLGDRHGLKDRIVIIAYERKTGKPIGFAAQTYLNLPFGKGVARVLHLGLTWVDKKHRNKSLPGILNIMANVLILVKYGFRPIWISNVSQVPVILGTVGQFYEHSYPDFTDDQKQLPIHKRLSTGIMEYHRGAFGVGEDAVFRPEKQVIENAYTGGSDSLKKSFEECSKFRDPRVNEVCKDTLDYERGDDYLQLGLLTPSVVRQFFQCKSDKIDRIYHYTTFLILAFFKCMAPVFRLRTINTHKFNYHGV